MGRRRAKRKLEQSFSSDSDESKYEIDAIVDERMRSKKTEYLVKWTGYSSDEASWVPAEDVSSDAVRVWQGKKSKKTRRRSAQSSKQPAHASANDNEDERAVVEQAVDSQDDVDEQAPDKDCLSVALNNSNSMSDEHDEVPEEPMLSPLPEKIVGKRVAFSPAEEPWMNAKVYRNVGMTYLIGVIARMASTRQTTFEVRWTNTQFQGKAHVHVIEKSVAVRGMNNHAKTVGNAMHGETWEALCRFYPAEAEAAAVDDNFEVAEHDLVRFEAFRPSYQSLADVEGIAALKFEPGGGLQPPNDLFTHPDGSTDTRIREACRAQFEHSASSSLFAYLSLSFWKQVVENTNAYEEQHKMTQVTLDEMMVFLGILFYMSLVDRGEIENYWGEQAEDVLFDGISAGMERFMSIRRFKFIRQNLCFRHNVSPEDLKRDPLVRIRPLLNIWKVRSSRFVDLGRNCVVDEASVACRSKFGRHLIVLNSSKPTGKYHFKIYALCCSTSWIAVNFRVHCSSTIAERLSGVIGLMEEELKESSEIRKIVLEVTLPLAGSKRIINTDNFYTSGQLRACFRHCGLYGRGTVRQHSKHFPRVFKIAPSDGLPRGSLRHGVCHSSKIIAASWVDSSIVSVSANADGSDITSVYRRIKQEKTPFPRVHLGVVLHH